MEFETVIGLEVHCELKTQSKIFCTCRNKFTAEPNRHCCPVCNGYPGVLPVLNKRAVEYTIMAGLALNCDIAKLSRFDRKHYFYPDLSKSYQTSQLDYPLCKRGRVDITVDGKRKSVRINRIHLEEDAGKLVHSEWGNGTLVDYNRAAVPLIEIVTEPDINSADEAVAFLESIKTILKYTGVSDCKMEEGSLRCDVNLSIRPKGSTGFGVRTEMKNLNSFRAVHRSILYEGKRHAEVLRSGGELVQETRRWDDEQGVSLSMRTKEDAIDYKYFPDPDLMPLVLTDEYIESLRAHIPELPEKRKERYVSEYGLPEYDADVLTSDKAVADFFDSCAKDYDNRKALSNWVMSDVLRKIKESGLGEDEPIPVSPANFVKLLKLYDGKVISQNAARMVLDEIWQNDRDPAEVVEKMGLKQITDEGELLKMVKEIIQSNPGPVADYKAGNKKALAFFVGQIMKATKGKANPQKVNELLVKELES
ncbi:MAG: Asp-tRNA(Asn)/Glu-tRNA(Gln) amidotransferase subunit GatB [Clostridiales bacterium]|jgi:aspartyl-tRNA(Asn)/glutamyl-tRNA(Gln) amidotransferase subunit B|nr:Asp-tRNA(Asn)/Glu-tRNA(Gln) amidotransferase subunit GatB [Clostridiales bacterium]